MKNFFNLLAIILLLATVTSNAQSTTKPRKENTQVLTDISQRIGVSINKAREYQALIASRNEKLRAVNRSTLSPAEKQQRKDAIMAQGDKDLRVLLNSRQFAAHEAYIKHIDEVTARRIEDVKQFQIEYWALKELPESERYEAGEALIDRHVAHLRSYMNNDRVAAKYILSIDIYSKANDYLDRFSGVTDSEKYEIGKVLRTTAKSKSELLALKQTNPDIPRSTYYKKQDEINAYEAKHIEAIIGSAKMQALLHYKASTQERLYKSRLGFSNEEYEIYADVMNRLAIEELAAKRSGMTQSEKDARVSEARAQSIESLRAQLSPTTFEKWHSYHQMRQARIAERRAKMLK